MRLEFGTGCTGGLFAKVGGMGGEAMEKEDAPADIPAYGRWVPLPVASQMSGGRGKEGEAAGILLITRDGHRMTRSRVSYNVTQNNGGVEDPQYLSNFKISWQNQGKTTLSPARQPY